ncbi:MAG TPA: uroporphyrinogen-III C-methyltransferase [Planctomycetes bacterium]|nr:uroporphyrinogen-III C-methyltransferase [Planctomycetota bacterium]
MTTMPSLPTVYLVGAGPGDPGLVTLRAVECLRRADLVLYDYLVNPAILEHAPATADLVCLGHHSTGRAMTPEEINGRIIEAARQGKTVVHLKGGDPSIFARRADQTGALREAGIRYEIVPGITAGLAAAAYCEIPVTHHEDASAVALVTGCERSCKETPSLDYRALARFPGTLVFYMGVRSTERWSRALIDGGKPADTPVAIVRWCTRADQRTVRCQLGQVAEAVRRHELRPPVVFVVGKVVDRAPVVSWFAARPLAGVRVLVTGSVATAHKLRDRLVQLGAEVMIDPAIRILPPADWGPLDHALDRLDQYDWLVFSSANGVDYFFGRLRDRGLDARRLGRIKLAAVGSGTAERLEGYHLRADLVPEQFHAESLARALASKADGQRFLLACADRGRAVLAGQLEAAGARVDRVVVYRSQDVRQPDPAVAASLSAGEIDWVTVASSATAHAVVRLYGEALRQARLASISPLTSAALRQAGFEPAVEASPHTMTALVEAILEAATAGEPPCRLMAMPT